MLAALNTKKEIVFGPETQKDEGPFFCPSCNSELNLRKGEIKIHHFSHKVKNNCFRIGESLSHMEAKYRIYLILKTIFKDKVHMEYNKFRDFIPDVYVNIKTPFAVEIQHSKLTNKVFEERTQKYIDNNIRVYWVFLLKDIKFYSENEIVINSMHSNSMKLYKSNIYIFDKSWQYIEKWKLAKAYSYYQGYTYYTHYGTQIDYPDRYVYLKTRKTIISKEKKFIAKNNIII